jgi:hypothetical protein
MSGWRSISSIAMLPKAAGCCRPAVAVAAADRCAGRRKGLCDRAAELKSGGAALVIIDPASHCDLTEAEVTVSQTT